MQGRLGSGKTVVMGLLERETGAFRYEVINTLRRHKLQGTIKATVQPGSVVLTDNFGSYRKLPAEYVHKVIDHAEKYVEGQVHTNGLENFWSLLKRAVTGTCVSIEPFHLFRYLDEQAFRNNTAK